MLNANASGAPTPHSCRRRTWQQLDMEGFVAVAITSMPTSNCKELRVVHNQVMVSSATFFFFFAHIYFPASGQAVVAGVVPFPPPVLAFIFYRA